MLSLSSYCSSTPTSGSRDVSLVSPEITGSQCLCGCLSRMLQRWNRWDSRLPLLCSSSAVASTLLNVIIFFITKNILTSLFLLSMVLGTYITLFVIAKPYREVTYNKTDMPVLMSLLLASVSGNIIVLTYSTRQKKLPINGPFNGRPF